MTKTELIQILSGCIGSIGFGILFNIRGKRLAAAGLGGLLSWLLYVLFSHMTASETACYFLVALLLGIYSGVLARIMKTPATAFAITSLIPLIPGGSLYYTMASAFEGDFEIFLEKAVHTLGLSAALALGIILATALTRSAFHLFSRKNAS